MQSENSYLPDSTNDSSTLKIRDLRTSNWFWVNKEVWQDPNLNSSDKTLYATLAYYANSSTQRSFPSLDTLCQFCAVSQSTVQRSLKHLKTMGYIKVDKKDGKVSTYTLLEVRGVNLTGVSNKGTTLVKEGQVPWSNKGTNNNNINNNNLTILPSARNTQKNDVEKAEKGPVPHSKNYEDIEKLFTFWGERTALVKHRKLTPKIEHVINARIEEGYTLTELQQAIMNYELIKESSDYFFNYAWTLDEFLQRGLVKFIDLELARKSYSINKGGKTRFG